MFCENLLIYILIFPVIGILLFCFKLSIEVLIPHFSGIKKFAEKKLILLNDFEKANSIFLSKTNNGSDCNSSYLASIQPKTQTPEPGDGNGSKSVTKFFFDVFLKYQYIICVEPQTPLTHQVIISLLTCISGSFIFVMLYGLSIFFIVFNIYLSEKFPNSFGNFYIALLKRNSSKDVFENYCGNPFEYLKFVLSNPRLKNLADPQFLEKIIKNGGGKFVGVTGAAVVTEHVVHHSKLGQVIQYKVEKNMNGGIHPTGPFLFRPNGQSIADSWVGRNKPSS